MVHREGKRASAVGDQLSAISYQLSAISYQLSAISYQLSAISYQSPTPQALTPRLVAALLASPSPASGRGGVAVGSLFSIRLPGASRGPGPRSGCRPNYWIPAFAGMTKG